MCLTRKNTATSLLENLGGGKFKVKPLPVLAQIAPVNGVVSSDLDSDGDLDLAMVGNDFGNEVFTGRHDAFYGLVLMNDGAGSFSPLAVGKSGFEVRGDGKSLVTLFSNNRKILLATQNREHIKVFSSADDAVVKYFV